MTDFSPRELAGRYVAVWTEPDAELRRKVIQELWAEDGAHILQPPQEIRQAAAGLGFTSAVLEARGHDELQARVTRAYQDFVAPGQFTFTARDNAARLHNVVKFPGTWSPLPAARRQAPAWRSSSSAKTAASRPTTSSLKPDRALPAPLANEATATSVARGRSQVSTMTAPGSGTPTPT
jgi:hypothetical protein